jgi:hypothetical protein
LRTHKPTASEVHFDPSGAPTAHATETKISLSAQETLGFPVTTRNVAEAVGPGSPFSPFAPATPCGPGSPFSPFVAVRSSAARVFACHPNGSASPLKVEATCHAMGKFRV